MIAPINQSKINKLSVYYRNEVKTGPRLKEENKFEDYSIDDEVSEVDKNMEFPHEKLLRQNLTENIKASRTIMARQNNGT